VSVFHHWCVRFIVHIKSPFLFIKIKRTFSESKPTVSLHSVRKRRHLVAESGFQTTWTSGRKPGPTRVFSCSSFFSPHLIIGSTRQLKSHVFSLNRRQKGLSISSLEFS